MLVKGATEYSQWVEVVKYDNIGPQIRLTWMQKQPLDWGLLQKWRTESPLFDYHIRVRRRHMASYISINDVLGDGL